MLVAVSVALAAMAVTSYKLAVSSWLVRCSMVAERVITVLLSATVTVARIAIASAISA